MKRLAYFVGVVTVLFLSSEAQAVTGNEYRALNEVQRQAWVAGVVDGILTAQLSLTNQQPPLAQCLAKLEVSQQRAIFEKALEADPERWHFPAAFKFLETFQRHCVVE